MKKSLLFVPALFLAAMGTLNAQTYFSENFESTSGTAIPATWTKTQPASNTTSGWESGTALGSTYFTIGSHTRYVAVNDDITQSASTDANVDNSNDFLYSPSFSLAGATNPVLTFDLTYYAATSPVETGTVEISTNGGTTWTVLETLGSYTTWTNLAVNLSAYDGAPSVMIGFRYNDGNSWAYGMALDNVSVIEPAAKEYSVPSIIMNKYVLTGSQPVQAVFKSLGGTTVTSATLKYSLDGGAAVSQTFSPGIGYGASYTASFTTNVTLTAGLHTVKAWVSDVNSTGPDATPTDDTATFHVSALATQPAKNVLLEEYTGAWCGYCPRGGIALTSLCNSDATVIGAAIHDNDQMSTTEGNVVDAVYPTGYPTGTIDRSYDASASTPGYALDNSDWSSYIAVREADVVPATVSLSAVNFNTGTRVITATVNADFVGAVQGTYALNCYVVENRVYGPLSDQTDNGWNNHSYYYPSTSGLPALEGVGLVAAPWSTSVAGLMPTDYVHNHVVDKMIGGAYGDNTVVPTTPVAAGTNFSKTFTFTLPAANPSGAHRYNPENIYIVGIVEEYDASHVLANQYILNVTEQKLNTSSETGLSGTTEEATSVSEIQASFGTVAVYPNPASTSTNIGIELTKDASVSISVYNTLGQVVMNETHNDLSAGTHSYNLNTENLANGIYNIIINTNYGSVTKKVVISK